MKSAYPISLKRIAIAACLLTATGLVHLAHAQERAHIGRTQIDTMFSNMRKNAPWKVDGPLLWGYFFDGQDRKKLEQLAAELNGKGYGTVGINAQQDKLVLHVEKVETHTPASLDDRDQEFYAVAERYGVFYDGMDVGPAVAPAK